MASDRDEKIRARAYQLWEEAGYPEGRDEEHWHKAVGELDEGEATGAETGDPLENIRDTDIENEIVPGTTGTTPDVSGQPKPGLKDSALKPNKEKAKPDIEKASLTAL